MNPRRKNRQESYFVEIEIRTKQRQFRVFRVEFKITVCTYNRRMQYAIL